MSSAEATALQSALCSLVNGARQVGAELTEVGPASLAASVVWSGPTGAVPTLSFSTPHVPGEATDAASDSEDNESTAGVIDVGGRSGVSDDVMGALETLGAGGVSTKSFASMISTQVLAYNDATDHSYFPEVVADYTRRRMEKGGGNDGSRIRPEAAPLRAALAAYVRNLEEESVIFFAQKLVNCSPVQPSCRVSAVGLYCEFECATCLCHALKKSQEQAHEPEAAASRYESATIGDPAIEEPPPGVRRESSEYPQMQLARNWYLYDEAVNGDRVKYDYTEIYKDLYSMKGSTAQAQAEREELAALIENESETEAFTRYFWLNRFRAVLNRLSEARKQNNRSMELKLLTEVGALSWSFCGTAEMYTRVIVSEYHLKTEDKSIKPADIGGVAGGFKFVAGGILFKFAVDVYGIYNGDDNAAKAAQHEIKGLDAVYRCLATDSLGDTVEGMSVPLSCVVTYKGHRVVASSILPVAEDTLVYGSADGGSTCHKDDIAAARVAEALGQRLNLELHQVAGVDMALCGDFEIHRGMDDKLYCLDFARIFPPEPLDAGSKRDRSSAPLWYRLFRGEFVLSNPEAMVSDVFTPWNMSKESQRVQHERVAHQAYDYMLEESIPNFARWLSEKPLVGIDLTAEMHTAGINVRHLLVLIQHMTNPDWVRILVAELFYRAHKKILGGVLRAASEKSGSLPADYDYIMLGLKYINNVFASGGRSIAGHRLWIYSARYIARRFTRPSLEKKPKEAEAAAVKVQARVSDPAAMALEALTGQMHILMPGIKGCIRDYLHWGHFFKRLCTRSDIRVLPSTIARYSDFRTFPEFAISNRDVLSFVDVVGMGISTNAMQIAALGRGLQAFYHVEGAAADAAGNDAIIPVLEIAVNDMLRGGITDTPYRVEYVLAIMKLGMVLVGKRSPTERESIMAIERWLQANELIRVWFDEEEASLFRPLGRRNSSYDLPSHGRRTSSYDSRRVRMSPNDLGGGSAERRREQWRRALLQELELLQKLMGTMFFLPGMKDQRQLVLERLLLLLGSDVMKGSEAKSLPDRFSLLSQAAFSVITGGRGYEPLFDLMPIVPVAVEAVEARWREGVPPEDVEAIKAAVMQAMTLERWSAYFAGTKLAPSHEDHSIFTSWVASNQKAIEEQWSFPWHMPFGGSSAAYEIRSFNYGVASRLLDFANTEVDKSNKLPHKFIAFNHMIFALTRAADWQSLQSTLVRMGRIVEAAGLSKKPRGAGGHVMKVYEMVSASVPVFIDADVTVERLLKVASELQSISEIYSDIKSLTEFFALYYHARILMLAGSLVGAKTMITTVILPMATEGHRIPIVIDCSMFLGALHLLEACEAGADDEAVTRCLANAVNSIDTARKMEDVSSDDRNRTLLMLDILEGLAAIYAREMAKIGVGKAGGTNGASVVNRMVTAIQAILTDDGIASTSLGEPLLRLATFLQGRLSEELTLEEAAALGTQAAPESTRKVSVDHSTMLRPTPPPKRDGGGSEARRPRPALYKERTGADDENSGSTPTSSQRLRATALSERFSTMVKETIFVL